MNNREAKHQDMQIPPSLIGATYSNCVNCTLSDRKCDTSSKCAKLDSENRQTGQISKLLHPISL